ncbi:MAG: fluoride efflux transporter CrcB [Actinomycetota bacterium]|nr:fluoride efflux transporter CrcB [Actinomycetota bacterium]
MIYLFVALGGFVGAPSRYLIDRAVNNRVESDLPWGTFLVNISGSFVLGLLTGLSLSNHLSSVAKALLGTGFCGAYTTFSTFTFETVRLVEVGQYLEATLNAVVSLVVGLVGASVGFAIGLAV